MAVPYVGEIRMFAGNFAPTGWKFCNGDLLSISENETLFTLIGTTYGGDGQETFALPDMRGRVPIHQGSGFILAETGGAEEITLSVGQIPAHTHGLAIATTPATTKVPNNHILAAPANSLVYRGGGSATTLMNAQSIEATGGSQPHSNMQPYQCINFIISLYGIFPSPS